MPFSRCTGQVFVSGKLAFTLADFNAEEKTLTVSKSYQRIDGKDVITEPKTPKSNRVIPLPDFLVTELEDYVGRLYGLQPDDKLFNITKAYLEKEMVRGAKLSGVKRIRLHDLRHSHASLLISKLGVQPNLVADRLGHEKNTPRCLHIHTCILINPAILLIS